MSEAKREERMYVYTYMESDSEIALGQGSAGLGAHGVQVCPDPHVNHSSSARAIVAESKERPVIDRLCLEAAYNMRLRV